MRLPCCSLALALLFAGCSGDPAETSVDADAAAGWDAAGGTGATREPRSDASGGGPSKDASVVAVGSDAALRADVGGVPDAATLVEAGVTSDAGLFVPGVPRPDGAAPLSLVGCTYASPVVYEAGAGGSEVLIVHSEVLTALSTSGDLLWDLVLPAPNGEMAFGVSTPVVIENRLVVGYHTVVRTTEPHDVNRARIRHRMVVVDLAARALDPAFPPFDLQASFPAGDAGTVDFLPSNALGRSELAHVPGPAGALGRVYVAFGNARDIQPWHGFLFELDLDAWVSADGGTAISAAFLSTPETDCGTPGSSGSRTRLCGGGMWAPSGPLVVERGSGFELFVSTGNGQLDLSRQDYANSVLRFSPGLTFDPGCDPTACAGFDADAPSLGCVESCEHLFIPRTDPGDPFPMPESGTCDGLTLFECWEKLDYIGGSTPAFVKLSSGTEVLAYPAKDGALYLFDADHLGTMYDRAQLVEVCGTPSDPCRWDWAGMIVTEPALTEATGEPLLLVPTFMPDRTHPAGVVAVAIDEASGTPKLTVRWQTPSFTSAAAVERFREHPSRIRLSDDGRFAWVVEASRGSAPGKLLGIRVADGAIIVDQELRGKGYRFTQPLLVGDRLFVPSCQPDVGPSEIEIFDVGALTQ